MYDIELEPEPIRRILNYYKLFEIVKVSVDLGIYARITSPLTAVSYTHLTLPTNREV